MKLGTGARRACRARLQRRSHLAMVWSNELTGQPCQRSAEIARADARERDRRTTLLLVSAEPAEHQVFEVTFQSLQRTLGDTLTAEVKAELAKLGVDYDKPLLPAYPLEVWNRVLNFAAERLYPTLSPADRHVEMGRRVLDSFSQSIIGSVLLAMVRVAGPRRMLDRSARNMRQANNYTVVTLEDLAPRHVVMHFNRVTFPDFYKGLILRGLELSGGKNGTITWEKFPGDRVDLIVRWE